MKKKMSLKKPFCQRKEVFMEEVWNEERNYGDHPGSIAV